MKNSLRVLLIEDSENDALLIDRYLLRGGYETTLERVWTVADLQAALDDQTWDVIISDYSLPEFNGLGALQLVKQKQLDTPFIVVSGAIGEDLAVDIVKAGAHDYVMKNNLARLAPAITRELREAEIRRQRNLAEAEVRRQNSELALLNRLIAATTALSDPVEILAMVCRELAQFFNVTTVTAVELDPAISTARVVAQHPPAARPASPTPIQLKDNPLVQYLLTYKMPLVINPVQQDLRLQDIHTILCQPETTSLILLPLLNDDRVFGSICLASKEPRDFTPAEIRLAESIAYQISGAVARARLDAAHRLLTQAIEQAAESVIITETTGNIVYANPAFERISGYTVAEIVGQNTSILRSGKHNSQFYQKLWESITTGQVWHGRQANTRKDGTTYHTEVTISPVRDKHGTIVNFVTVQRDVTRETQLEEQYHQAQKMEAIGQLTAGIAHDFNNLLTAINGFASLLHTDLSAVPEQIELLEKIMDAGQRAADLVKQLLMFSRKQEPQPQLLDLNRTVAHLHKMLQRIIGEHIQLHLDLTPNLKTIKADPTHIEQIIMNLAINARDAMPNGGQLTMTTANVALSTNHPAYSSNTATGPHVRFAITDTGVGMTDDIKKHIFEPFFTTKEPGKGTGLGLATVQGIVRQAKGNILVHSYPGTGTTFEIYLPCITTTEKPVYLPPPVHATTFGQETILVVEDDEFVGDLVRRLLKNEGYTVLQVMSTRDALRLASDYTAPIHLLLTDVVIPDGAGTLLAKQLTQARPKLKVLYMSGYADSTLAQYGLLDPGPELLQKPFKKNMLIHSVRAALDG